MSRHHSYINTTEKIISRYDGKEPFALFLRKYFKQHTKHGSRDRKLIAHTCYCYFRLGKSLPVIDFAKRAGLGLFLNIETPAELLAPVMPVYEELHSLSLHEKLDILKSDFGLQLYDIFPWYDKLSVDIDIDSFLMSHLKQPDLYLRIRPGSGKKVIDQLERSGIHFKKIADETIALPNSLKIDDVIEVNRDAVVQDYSSQQTGELLKGLNNIHEVWDCCAASGGKSILAYDILHPSLIVATDVREKILHNLEKRFKEAGIKKFRTAVVDLTRESALKKFNRNNKQYDLVICDAPCTGSGTWSRTPERLFYFDEKEIEQFSYLQKRITNNIIPFIKQGGHLLYITCSVFKMENETVTQEISKQLELLQEKVITGYTNNADTMYAALFRK